MATVFVPDQQECPGHCPDADPVIKADTGHCPGADPIIEADTNSSPPDPNKKMPSPASLPVLSTVWRSGVFSRHTDSSGEDVKQRNCHGKPSGSSSNSLT